MKSLRFILMGVLAVSCAFGQTSVPPAAAKKTVAIFVRNDSGKPALDVQASALGLMISAHLGGSDFSVIDHNLAIRNFNAYIANPNSPHRDQALAIKRQYEKTGTVDTNLFDSASGLRIAEFVGADYVLAVSFASLGEEKRAYEGYGIRTQNETAMLRSSYNLYEVGSGQGAAGGWVRAARVLRQSDGLGIQTDDVINDLVDETASQMATLLQTQARTGQIAATEAVKGTVTFEFVLESLVFPQIREVNGQYLVSAQTMSATVTALNAELDGVALSLNADGAAELAKGIHPLRLVQKDIVPLDKAIYVTGKPDQRVTLFVALTDEAAARWKNDMAFFQELTEKMKQSDRDYILTEAEAKRLEGLAELFKNSGINLNLSYDKKGLF